VVEVAERAHALGLPLLAEGELKVAPSILSADFGALGAEIAKVASVDRLAARRRDGRPLRPHITIGPPVGRIDQAAHGDVLPTATL